MNKQNSRHWLDTNKTAVSTLASLRAEDISGIFKARRHFQTQIQAMGEATWKIFAEDFNKLSPLEAHKFYSNSKEGDLDDLRLLVQTIERTPELRTAVAEMMAEIMLVEKYMRGRNAGHGLAFGKPMLQLPELANAKTFEGISQESTAGYNFSGIRALLLGGDATRGVHHINMYSQILAEKLRVNPSWTRFFTYAYKWTEDTKPKTASDDAKIKAEAKLSFIKEFAKIRSEIHQSEIDLAQVQSVIEEALASANLSRENDRAELQSILAFVKAWKAALVTATGWCEDMNRDLLHQTMGSAETFKSKLKSIHGILKLEPSVWEIIEPKRGWKFWKR